MYIDDIKKLVGLTITGVSHDDDECALTFADGRVALFRTYGDCCSTTWIEHLEVPKLGRGAQLLEVEEVDVGGEQNHPKHDCLQFYETRFKTTAGDIVVEYRNSSNGYYGGSLELVSIE